MNNKSVILFIIGIAVLVITGLYCIWWNENAPYCCTHQCCATHNMMDCFGSLLIPTFLIIGLMFITSSIYGRLREK